MKTTRLLLSSSRAPTLTPIETLDLISLSLSRSSKPATLLYFPATSLTPASRCRKTTIAGSLLLRVCCTPAAIKGCHSRFLPLHPDDNQRHPATVKVLQRPPFRPQSAAKKNSRRQPLLAGFTADRRLVFLLPTSGVFQPHPGDALFLLQPPTNAQQPSSEAAAVSCRRESPPVSCFCFPAAILLISGKSSLP